MKITLNYLMTLTVCLGLISCNNTDNTKSNENQKLAYYKLKQASWLIGSWYNQSPDGILTESWEKKNDSSFIGKSCFLAGKDTLSFETLLLTQEGNDIFYIPTVKGQNNNEPITFALTSSSSTQMVFENPKHDFPQKITYSLINNDSMIAEISGMVEGKINAQTFPLKREK